MKANMSTVSLILLLGACADGHSTGCTEANAENLVSASCDSSKISADVAPRESISPSAPAEPVAAASAGPDSGAVPNAIVEQKEEEMRRAQEQAREVMASASARVDPELKNITDNANKIQNELNAINGN